jgi:pectate lyase
MGLLTSAQVCDSSHAVQSQEKNTDIRNIENDWGPATINITRVGNFTKAPYKYKLTSLAKVQKVVKKGAGLGKIRV